MFEFVMTVCLIANPGQCKDVPLSMTANHNVMQHCVLSQSEMAKWIMANEGWQIKGWQCGPQKTIKASM